MRLGPISQQIIRFDSFFGFTGHEHERLYELVVGLSGVVGARIGDQERFVREDELLVLERGVFHVFWEAAAPAAYWNVYFEGDVPLLDRVARRRQTITLPPQALGRFWRDPAFARESPERLAHAVLGLALAADGLEAATTSPPAAIGFEERVRRRLTDLVLAEPGRQHDLADIARVFGVGKTHLASKVKHATGFTVMRLYYEAKIALARERLRQGASVKEVALALGFSDPYHFSKKFKELVGHPPSRVSEG